MSDSVCVCSMCVGVCAQCVCVCVCVQWVCACMLCGVIHLVSVHVIMYCYYRTEVVRVLVDIVVPGKVTEFHDMKGLGE